MLFLMNGFSRSREMRMAFIPLSNIGLKNNPMTFPYCSPGLPKVRHSTML